MSMPRPAKHLRRRLNQMLGSGPWRSAPFSEIAFDRLDTHANGNGARLVAVIWQAGIGFTLIRICEGTRRRERAIKNAGGAVRYCPVCTPHPRNGRWGPLPADLTPRTYLNLAGRR